MVCPVRLFPRGRALGTWLFTSLPKISKLDRVVSLTDQLVRLQSSDTALVLPRFCLDWCQTSCHACTMPQGDRPHSLPGRHRPKYDSPRRHLAPRSGVYQERGVAPTRCSTLLSSGLPGLQHQHRNPPQHPVRGSQRHTTRVWWPSGSSCRPPCTTRVAVGRSALQAELSVSDTHTHWTL